MYVTFKTERQMDRLAIFMINSGKYPASFIKQCLHLLQSPRGMTMDMPTLSMAIMSQAKHTLALKALSRCCVKSGH